MNNETTMPGLLTLPADLRIRPRKERRQPLYRLIFVIALLVLAITLYLR